MSSNPGPDQRAHVRLNKPILLLAHHIERSTLDPDLIPSLRQHISTLKHTEASTEQRHFEILLVGTFICNLARRWADRNLLTELWAELKQVSRDCNEKASAEKFRANATGLAGQTTNQGVQQEGETAQASQQEGAAAGTTQGNQQQGAAAGTAQGNQQQAQGNEHAAF